MYSKTVDDLLKQIHVEYEGDTDYLEFEDEEVQLRVAHLKRGIEEWVERFPEYREVFTDLTSASDGDKVTAVGTTIYNCPTNFIRPANLVKIGSTYYGYIPPEKVALKLKEDSSSYWFTITGRPGAFKLRVNPSPTAVATIEYDYWKTVTIPTLTTQTVEVSRPKFVVYYVLWKLFGEDDPVRAKENKDAMDEEERRERVALAKTPGEPNKIEVNGAGFGDNSSSVVDIVTDQ